MKCVLFKLYDLYVKQMRVIEPWPRCVLHLKFNPCCTPHRPEMDDPGPLQPHVFGAYHVLGFQLESCGPYSYPTTKPCSAYPSSAFANNNRQPNIGDTCWQGWFRRGLMMISCLSILDLSSLSSFHCHWIFLLFSWWIFDNSPNLVL